MEVESGTMIDENGPRDEIDITHGYLMLARSSAEVCTEEALGP